MSAEVPPPTETRIRTARSRLGAARGSNQFGLWVPAGFVVQVLVRLPYLRQRDGPLVVADEIGYLLNARVLAGGPAGHLENVAVYRGGYALVIAPVSWITSDPSLQYRLILLLNVLLTASCFPALVALLRRATRASRMVVYTAAFVACLYPAFLLTSQFAWSENLLPLLVVLLLYASQRLLAPRGRHRVAWALAIGALGSFGVFTHERMYAVIPVLVIVLVLAALEGRLSWRIAALVGVVTVVLLGLAVSINQWLAAVNYGGKGAPQTSQALGKLTSIGGWWTITQESAGQWWTVMASSLGLAALGLVVLVDPTRRSIRRAASLFRSRGPKPPPGLSERKFANDHIAMLVVALVVCLSIVVAASFAEPLPALLFFVYGRYLEPVAPVLVAFGAVAFLARPVRRDVWVSAVALVAFSSVLILMAAGPRVFSEQVVASNSLGLTFLAGGVDLKLATVTVITVTALAATAVFSRWRSTRVLVVVALALTFVASATYRSAMFSGNPHEQLVVSGSTVDRVPAVQSAHHIGIDFSAGPGPLTVQQVTYQFYTPTIEMTPITTVVPDDVDVVVAPSDWPLAAEVGASSLWHDPGPLGWDVWVIGRPAS